MFSGARNFLCCGSYPLKSYVFQQRLTPSLSAFTPNGITFRLKTAATKHKKVSGRAADGRVVFRQQLKGGNSRLCSGCGTEVISGRSEGMVGGEDALNASSVSGQKAQRARYFDMGDRSNADFLCSRCKSLKLENIWTAYDALHDVSPEVFGKQLNFITQRRKFGMCIMVVDATDPMHSAIKNMRKWVGKLPVLLVINKVDLLPRISYRDIRTLKQQVNKVCRIQFLDSFVISAKKEQGILAVVEWVLSRIGGRDIFVVGSANVGKSTFVKAFARIMSEHGIFKGTRGRNRARTAADLNVTSSHLPGTTLQAVRVPCFQSSGHALWDTPGIIQSSAVQYSLFPAHLMEPLARPGRIEVATRENGLRFSVRRGESILLIAQWMEEEVENIEPTVLGRIDVIEVESRNVMVNCYFHPSLAIKVVPTDKAPDSAVIASEYVTKVQSRMNKKLEESYELPLARYLEVKPEVKELTGSGFFNVDVCFASLGWAHFSSDKSFVLDPRCVKGSRFSRRQAMYPAMLEQVLERVDDTHGFLDEQWRSGDIGKRLRNAQREGKGSQPTRRKSVEQEEFFGDSPFDDNPFVADTEFW